jgi:hypothetical protein
MFFVVSTFHDKVITHGNSPEKKNLKFIHRNTAERTEKYNDNSAP